MEKLCLGRAWDEYEIESHGVAELVITSTNPILIPGGVAADAGAIASIESILNNGSVVLFRTIRSK